MEDGTDVEVDGLEAAEGPLDTGKALIGAHRIGGIESIGWNAGMQHVEAVERGLCGDRGVIAREVQRVVGDGDTEVLGDLAATQQGADRQADLVGPAQWLSLAQGAGLNVLQILLGGIEQLASFAPAFLGKGGVLADDEALAREVRTFDLGQVALVEQRELQGSALGGELLDRRGSQRGDPVEPGRLELVLDAGLRDHPAVADHDDTLEPEAVLELGDLITERRWITGIAFEHLDRDWTTFGRAQEPEHDLHLVAAAVPRMAEARQLAAASLHIARAHVIE